MTVLFLGAVNGCARSRSNEVDGASDHGEPALDVPSGESALLAPNAAAWTDEFDTLDTKATWLVQLYGFDASGCNFLPEMILADNSILKITVDTNHNEALPKPFNGGDMGTYQFRPYGLYLTRMKPSGVRGGVSAFYLMNQWQPANWEHREIDLEFLGKDTTSVQLTTHDFQNGGTDWKSSPETVPLGFDYTQDFHVYGILWTENSITWFADEKVLRQTADYVPNEPLQIRVNAYVGNMQTPGVEQWLGPIHSEDLPGSAEYDWVQYFPLSALPTGYQ